MAIHNHVEERSLAREELDRDYRMRAGMPVDDTSYFPLPSKAESEIHREKYSCPYCALALGTGEAVGIGRDAYHPGCAVQMLAARKQAAD